MNPKSCIFTENSLLSHCKIRWFRGTCSKQNLYYAEIRVRHTVVKGCVAILVSHVGHIAQHVWRDMAASEEEVLHDLWTCPLLTGQTEPLLLHCAQTGALLQRQTDKIQKNLIKKSGQSIGVNYMDTFQTYYAKNKIKAGITTRLKLLFTQRQNAATL